MEEVNISDINQIPLDGSIPFINTPQVLCLGCNDLTDSEKMTLQAMMCFDYGRYVIDETGHSKFTRNGYCDVALERLAELRGLSKRAIQRHIDRLEEYGLIKRENRYFEGVQTSDRKRFILNSLFERQIEVDLTLEELGLQKRLSGDANVATSVQECRPGVNQTSPAGESHVTQINNVSNNKVNYVDVTTSESDLARGTSPSISNTPSPDFDELSADFLIGSTQPAVELKGKALIDKKLARGEYDRLKAKDLLEYFKQKHYETYKLHFSVPTNGLPMTLNILNKAFLSKYGAKKCIEIIDNMFVLYEKAGLKTNQYPRVTIVSLTQDWMINKLYDYMEGEHKAEEVQKTKQESAEYRDKPGEFTPFDPKDVSDEDRVLITSLRVPSYFWSLCRNGYISRDFIYALRTDQSEAKELLKEAVNQWNQNNQTKLRI